MIRRLIEPEEVALIISISDDVEDEYGCTKGEFVQLLISICKDPRVLIIGMFNEKDKLTGYIFAQNYISLLSKVIHIIYIYPIEDTEDNELCIEAIKEWARELGADKITTSIKNPEVLIGRYDFKESEYHILEIDL